MVQLTLLITRGAQGAGLVYDGSIYSIPAAPIPHHVNTTGAGDTFAAALLQHLRSVAAPEQALRRAAAAAALQMGGYAYFAQPDAAAVTAYLKQIGSQSTVQVARMDSVEGRAWLDQAHD